MNNTEKRVIKMAQAAKKAAGQLALVGTSAKNAALAKMAKALLSQKTLIKKENAKDIQVAQKAGYAKALVDRLILNDARIEAMADSLKSVAKLKDPVGEIINTTKRPNGLLIEKVRTPMGVVGIIFESRPNVTSDCIGLCLKSGNTVILKGGREAYYSNQAIFTVLKQALKGTKVPQEAVQLVASDDRQSINVLLKLDQYVDLIVPRGGEALIRFVAENSTIPVVKHYKGVCHTYVAKSADLNMAGKISFNAKVQRPSACNAMETLLVDKTVAGKFLPVICADLFDAGVEIRGDEKVRNIIKSGIKKATVKDWTEEYLDLILSIKVVNGVDEAIEHINAFGSHHSDAIVTKDKKEAEKFLGSVDSACVYVNASTRFTDGYEFGLGAEIGISTDKLHARGPMALEELTTYKYVVHGQGQIRA